MSPLTVLQSNYEFDQIIAQNNLRIPQLSKFAEFSLACHSYFYMLKDQIKQGGLPQIPSKLALHDMLPINQTIVMHSLRDYQLLSPPLIFFGV
jgi:hypothetical protein